MKRILAAFAGLLALGLALGACASTSGSDSQTRSWRKISQIEQRFAIFINEPGAPKTGDLVTFRLAYVYMPGEVKFEEKEVGWQEYAAMTVNCASDQVRTGPRIRYAPDGAVLASDNDQTFSEILYGTAAETAARARCKGEYKVPPVSFNNGGTWIEAARKHIAATPPPPPVQP